MSGKKGSKNLSPSEFNNLKLMQKAGIKAAQAAQITGRSLSTASIIYRFDTIEDYRFYNAARLTKAKKPVAEAAPVQQQQPVEDFQLVLSRLKTIEDCLNQLLHVIEDKEAKANASFWRR